MKKLSIVNIQIGFFLLNGLILFGLDWSSEPIITADTITYLSANGQRPWLIQYLFATLFEGNGGQIVCFQKVLHGVAAAFFVNAIIRIVGSRNLKIALIIISYSLFNWWNIVGWTHVILSESLCFSFLVITTSCLFMIFLSKFKYLWMILFICGVILTSGIRDHFHFIFLTISLITVIYSLLIDKRKTAYFSMVLVLCFIQSFYVSKAIKENARHTLVTCNLVQMRLIQIPEAKNYFINHGMPTPVELDTMIGQPSWAYDEYLFKTKKLEDYVHWIQTNGMETYQSFLISHPKYLITYPFTDREVYRLDAPTAYPNYPSNGIFWAFTILFPIFNFKTTLLLLILGIVNMYKSKNLNLFFVPLIFLCLGILEFYISYHADTREISRHLIRVSPLFQLSAFASIVLIIDNYLQKRNKGLKNELTSQIPPE